MNNTSDSCAVRIAVRERPLRENVESVKYGESVINYHSTNSNIIVVDERPFAFDIVLNPRVSQEEVFDILIKPLVGKVLQGFNCTALAYGQTGTGKSYSMGLDATNFEGENIGIIPRSLEELFKSGDNDENSLSTIARREIHVSFIEIYNEKVYDLLADNSTEPIIARGYRYTGGTRKEIASLQDCYNTLILGNKNRHVRPTKMNSKSSRSHAVFSIHLRLVYDDKVIASCLNLVDLAGSEGVRRTGHKGVAMSEGVHINQGLLTIGKVLHAMTMGYKVIPYRDSVLCTVLQDSLSPHSYLTLLACISPHKEDISETLSTLRFAQNAKQLKYTPRINLILSELKKNRPTPQKPKIFNGHFITKSPFKRSSSVLSKTNTPFSRRAPLHRQTIATPNKSKKIDVSKFNKTEIGMTPKAKQIASVAHGINPNIEMIRSHQTATGFNRGSLFNQPNDTMDSQTSLFPFNISTSTSLGLPEAKPASASYSPVVRKCMSEFEKIIDNKMEEIVRNLKNIYNTASSSDSAQTEGCKVLETQAKILPRDFRQEIEVIVQDSYQEKTAHAKNENFVSATISEEASELNKNTTPIKNSKCQPFATSSPVLKVTGMPGITNERKLNKRKSCALIEVEENCNGADLAFDFYEELPNQNLGTNLLRRSQRLSLKKINNSFADMSSTSITRYRQSQHLSSIKEINDCRRRSVRLAANLNKSQTDRKTIIVPEERKNMFPAELKNSVIATYFESKNLNIPKQKKTNTKKNHKKAILEIINTGSLKALKLLPQVGPKTAFHIITHRALNGKFKNLSEVERLPVWRGKAWERFSSANMLV